MRRIIREPLFHFLVLGAALFAAYSALHRGTREAPEEIVVTSGRIENLILGFTRVWQRPPTTEELKGLIDAHVKEEILSREAMKLGLDRDDTVIRRRLQQKMEFLAEDFGAARDPTDAELEAYLAKHPDQFAVDTRFSFRQVFLSREGHADRLEADAAAMLARLRERPSSDVSDLGDLLLLPEEFTDEPLAGVSAQFGSDFAAGLGSLKAGEWGGPIRSGYGVHLVLVTRRVEGRVPALGDVRDRVRQGLLDARRLQANQRLLDGLLAKYRITIEPVASEPAPVRLSGATR